MKWQNKRVYSKWRTQSDAGDITSNLEIGQRVDGKWKEEGFLILNVQPGQNLTQFGFICIKQCVFSTRFQGVPQTSKYSFVCIFVFE